jgi:hypothetical protein
MKMNFCIGSICTAAFARGDDADWGKDEAWYYFKENADIWKQSGELEWLQQVAAKK